VIAGVVRSFDFELFETSPDDILHYREYQIGFPKKESDGLRVEVTQVFK
jgi:hypothetical protein